MQSRSGNKCHLQCPQQANAIAKPNLRRYLALWSTAPPPSAPRRTCRAVCGRADAYRRTARRRRQPSCKKLCQDYYMESI